MFSKDITLAELEEVEGSPRNSTNEEDGLTKWYNKIRQKRLSELSDGDIARAIRQKIFLTHTVPEAIRRLMINPVLGDLYDGEVMTALAEIDEDFWISDSRRSEAKPLIELIKSGNFLTSDYQWTFEDDEENFYKAMRQLEARLGAER